jgi:hypothetical protein
MRRQQKFAKEMGSMFGKWENGESLLTHLKKMDNFTLRTKEM